MQVKVCTFVRPIYDSILINELKKMKTSDRTQIKLVTVISPIYDQPDTDDQ